MNKKRVPKTQSSLMLQKLSLRLKAILICAMRTGKTTNTTARRVRPMCVDHAQEGKHVHHRKIDDVILFMLFVFRLCSPAIHDVNVKSQAYMPPCGYWKANKPK